jgi:hypothetical protein
MHPRAGTSALSLKNEQKLMTTKNLNNQIRKQRPTKDLNHK